MRTTTSRRTERLRRTRRRCGVAVTATVTAGSLALGAVAATALWRSEDDFLGGLVTAGDLQLTTGIARWAQVTPGIDAPRSGELTGTPDDFYAMPGDIIEITLPVDTYLRGENLEAGIQVDTVDPSVSGDIEAGRIAVSFHVNDEAGAQVAPLDGDAPFGELVAIDGLVGTNDGSTESWTVVMQVEVLGDYVWTSSAPTAAALPWDAGQIDVHLRQVRT